jgi:Zn-finger nucleic acid-binding protein
MALVESRRYFRCGHCGSYHFPTSVESDGVRIVGHPSGAPKCPLCSVAMAHALLDDDHPIDFCARCRGVLMPRPTFAIVTMKRRAWAVSPPSQPAPLNREELQRELRCPKCSGRFETYPHLGPGAVVIDNCPRCDLLWLDFGELRQIVDAPGKDRGTRHVPRIDEEFIRQGAPPASDDDDDDDDGWPRHRRSNDPLGFLIDVMFDD